MDVRWKTLITKLTVWLVAEIILSLLGLDNLADYSEFLEDQYLVQIVHNHTAD